MVFHLALEYIAPAGDDAMAVSFEEVGADGCVRCVHIPYIGHSVCATNPYRPGRQADSRPLHAGIGRLASGASRQHIRVSAINLTCRTDAQDGARCSGCCSCHGTPLPPGMLMWLNILSTKWPVAQSEGCCVSIIAAFIFL